ncbi:hypothetical protein B0H11DRAFT_2276387, partial [Mycena galericulata]
MNNDSDANPSSGSDNENVSTGGHGGHKKLLDRSKRSLCRALRAGGISAEALSDYFGCAKNTINRVTHNSYKSPDNLENDILPADFEDILRAVKLKYNGSTVKTTEQPTRNRDEAIVTSPQNRGANAAAAATSTGAETTTVRRALPVRGQMSKATGTSLDAFVDGIPLDRAWAEVMRRAGWSEEKLRKIAGASEADLKNFIQNSSLLKDMLEIDKFMLALAIKRLA